MAAALREYDRRNVLVVDWGGGTLDLTLCQVNGLRLLQRRNSGSDDVGGRHFDEAIRNGVIEQFCKQAGIDAGSEVHADARIRLLHDSEENKIALSTRSSITFYRQGFFRNPDATLEFRLTREAMEEMTRPIVQAGMGRITELLESAGIGSSQVALCLVTGGMAAMPAISGRLHELFGPQRVEVSERSATLIAQGSAWIAHDRQRLRLAKTIELQLARGSYLPLIPADTEMPIEREEKKRDFHLYCSDPRDGSAKFQLCTPSRRGPDVQTSDSRMPIGNLIVEVDQRAKPFRERLELELTIDDDMILHASAWSADVNDRAEAEFHDLEFGISMPASLSPASRAHETHPPDTEQMQPSQPGDLVVRSNIANEPDDSLVPGELLHQYKRGYFEVAFRPPQVQVEEYLYYRPCAECGRPSSDPACRCASRGRRKSAPSQ
jgi:molecular chaperone DnaK